MSILSTPLKATWIPAHLFEGVPDHQLDPCAIAALGSTVRHVILNRRADATAKACAHRIAPIVPDMVAPLYAAATLHQDWLVRLHCQLATQDMQATTEIPKSPDSMLSLALAKSTFPKWDWNVARTTFGWKAKIPLNHPIPTRWKHTTDDWESICRFARSLRWRQLLTGPSLFVSLLSCFIMPATESLGTIRP